MQRRAHSILEVALNTASGFLTSLLTQWFVFPLFNINVAFHENVALTAIFTVVSVARSYFWRRLFNALHMKGVL